MTIVDPCLVSISLKSHQVNYKVNSEAKIFDYANDYSSTIFLCGPITYSVMSGTSSEISIVPTNQLSIFSDDIDNMVG